MTRCHAPEAAVVAHFLPEHLSEVLTSIQIFLRSELSQCQHRRKQRDGARNEHRESAASSASVDVVISNGAINLARDKTEVFREIHRILRPRGRFQFADVMRLFCHVLGMVWIVHICQWFVVNTACKRTR